MGLGRRRERKLATIPMMRMAYLLMRPLGPLPGENVIDFNWGFVSFRFYSLVGLVRNTICRKYTCWIRSGDIFGLPFGICCQNPFPMCAKSIGYVRLLDRFDGIMIIGRWRRWRRRSEERGGISLIFGSLMDFP